MRSSRAAMSERRQSAAQTPLKKEGRLREADMKESAEDLG